MNFKNIFSILSAFIMLAVLAGCDGEKELIIIDGNLQIGRASCRERV